MLIVLIPSLHMLPQEAAGGTTPIPINDKKASVNIPKFKTVLANIVDLSFFTKFKIL